MSKPKVIAFYLPQFHPTPDNDKWWGKGFTEWTNVVKAKPLFRGHYQPHIPADLGFYDLRLPEVREAQAELAKEAGIFGFCYWSYWFGNGKEELELPFDEVLRLGKPDFPFMLCWANESWHSKFWNKDGTVEKKILLEQKYPGSEDIIKHFYHRLDAFKDKRYIKYHNKPVFMIYEWQYYEDVSSFIKIWNELAIKEGFSGIFFIAHLKSDINTSSINRILELGFDGINTVRIWSSRPLYESKIKQYCRRVLRRFLGIAIKYDYKNCIAHLYGEEDSDEYVFPTLVPNWDHSPRSGNAGIIFNDCKPEYFERHCEGVLEKVKDKRSPNFVFLRAWNEWGEGNHMEPDLKYGKGYIEALSKAINKVCPT